MSRGSGARHCLLSSHGGQRWRLLPTEGRFVDTESLRVSVVYSAHSDPDTFTQLLPQHSLLALVAACCHGKIPDENNSGKERFCSPHSFRGFNSWSCGLMGLGKTSWQVGVYSENCSLQAGGEAKQGKEAGTTGTSPHPTPPHAHTHQ